MSDHCIQDNNNDVLLRSNSNSSRWFGDVESGIVGNEDEVTK